MHTPTTQPITVDRVDKALLITFNRPEAKNSLNGALIAQLHQALDEAESHPAIKTVVIQGNAQHFCTGMDFEESVNQSHYTQAQREQWNQHYMGLLQRLSNIPKVTLAAIEGTVIAGGMGIVAACDYAVATPTARFSLSEALWGLLPSMVLPYLIRRMGYQPAYRLTLTTQSIGAEEAHRIQLVDEITDNLPFALKQCQTRFNRLAPETVQDLKRYMYTLYPFLEAQTTRAIQETARLASEPRIQQNIAKFIHHQQFPWEA